MTTHLTDLLLTLDRDDYCKVAISSLPLNYKVVTLERALSYHDDALTAHLIVTYHMVGRLLELFREVVEHFTPCLELGQEMR